MQFIIEANLQMQSADGIEALSHVGQGVHIQLNPALTDLTAFSNLEALTFGPGISNNAALETLHGFDNLTVLGNDLILLNNPLLTDITALSGVTQFSGRIHIQGCEALEDISPLEGFSEEGIEELFIFENPLLQFCHFENICAYLEDESNHAEIHSNAGACSSRNAVEAAYQTLSAARSPEIDQVRVFPNPFRETVVIEHGRTDAEFAVYTADGRMVMSEVLGSQERVNLTGLKPGLYILEITGTGYRGRVPAVKQ